MTVGDVIKKYRKAAGITQEEMARRLGVTTPAVNKWENNNTQPDISLLAPIARLLGINTDTLLSFEQSLSDDEIAMFIKELNRDLGAKDYDDVFSAVKKKVDEYPNCDRLIWQAAVILNARRLTDDVPDKESYEEILFGWFERCLHSENEEIRKAAADSLFQAYLQKEEFVKAYSYISFLSTDSPERKRKEAVIFSKTGRKEEAYRTYEELLFSSHQFISLVLNNLRILFMEDGNHEMAWKLAGLEGQLAKAFEMGKYSEVCSGLDVAAWEKNVPETERIMRQILESVETIGAFSHSQLYQHLSFKKAEPGFAIHLRDSLAACMADESFAYMHGNSFWDEMTSSTTEHSATN